MLHTCIKEFSLHCSMCVHSHITGSVINGRNTERQVPVNAPCNIECHWQYAMFN